MSCKVEMKDYQKEQGYKETITELTKQRDNLNSRLSEAVEALEKYAFISHESCEDQWYSCPKSEEGCMDDRKGNDCTCGADKHNEEMRKILAKLKEKM